MHERARQEPGSTSQPATTARPRTPTNEETQKDRTEDQQTTTRTRTPTRPDEGERPLSLDLYLITVPYSAANPPSGPPLLGFPLPAALWRPLIPGGLHRLGPLLRRESCFPLAHAGFAGSAPPIRGGVDPIRGRLNRLHGRHPVCRSHPLGSRARSPATDEIRRRPVRDRLLQSRGCERVGGPRSRSWIGTTSERTY
jgi:hypothetical protein